MSTRTVVRGSVVGTIIVMFVVLVLAAGCPEEERVAQSSTENATCPVMGNPIDKSIFVEYQGKKVYCCGNGCPDVVKANPEKYRTKLPQFAI